MSKLAYGPASWHVLASGGPPPSPLHFYSTTYSVQHRRGDFPSMGPTPRHRGTGYASNFRPAVYYCPQLDKMDNPTMGKLLQDNYDTRTKKDYVRYVGPDGRDTFPSKVHPTPSGFAHNLPRTTPTSRQAREVHIDTARNGPVPTYPLPTPLLHTLQPRDPIAAENAGHGPTSMSTEYHTRFPRQASQDQGVESSVHSHKEKSGFTHAQNVEPVTFRPHENYGRGFPYMWRPTGTSIMRQDFSSPCYLRGSEPLLLVSGRADCSNGYVKGSKAMADTQPKASEMVGYTQVAQLHPTVLQRVRREDPAEYSIITHPHQYSSLTQRSFQGHQRSLPSEAQRLSREDVGRKELTGFSENTASSRGPSGPRDAPTPHTHYQQRFGNPNPLGSAREGHTGGGVQQALSNGFTKGTQVHRFGANVDTARILRHTHPYVARSIMKRNPYYDDHTHDSKLRTLVH